MNQTKPLKVARAQSLEAGPEKSRMGAKVPRMSRRLTHLPDEEKARDIEYLAR